MNNSISVSLTKNEIISSKTATAIIGVVSFVLLTTLGAYVYIPLGFTPVPITLQTFFVILSGAILGKKFGAISQISYIALGATGLPMFLSGSFGLAYLLGPTGGYILGFVAASYAIGKLLRNNDSLVSIVTALIIGEAIILSLGAGWLMAGLRFSLSNAFYLGVLPFIPGDIIKIIVASLICKKYLKRAKFLFC
ncbi:MAG: biotin transporter BioY [Candidatus Omnitrophota bacterium]